MSGALNQGIPQRMTAFVDPKTGLVDPVWWNFLHSLWTRTGAAAAASTPNDLAGYFAMSDEAEAVDWSRPGAIGSAVPAAGAFSTATVAGLAALYQVSMAFTASTASGFIPWQTTGFVYGAPSLGGDYNGISLGFNDFVDVTGHMLSYAYVYGRTGGGRGLRNGLAISMGRSAPNATGDTFNPNQVGLNADVYSTSYVSIDSYQGSAGVGQGGIWGIATTTRLSANNVGSVYGYEADVYAAFAPGSKVGMAVVQLIGDTFRGTREDAAFSVANQPGSLTTWRKGIAFGFSDGYWPLAADSTMLGVSLNFGAPAPGGPSPVARWGMDLKDVAFSANGGLWRTQGAAVGPTGQIGGQGVYGVGVTTTGTVQAQTASVGSYSILDGGNFPSLPTLAVAAPPAGVTATLTATTMAVATVEAIVGRGTSGFVVGDLMSFAGGTHSVTTVLRVDEINAAGQPTFFSINTAGNYTVLPASPVTLTGGSGAGTVTVTPGWAILTVTPGVAGSGYAVYPPPLVTSSTGTSYHNRMEIVPQMTPVAAPLAVNPSGGFTLWNVSTALTAAGISQATATAIPSQINVFGTVAAATGGVLPSGAIGVTITVYNRGANALNVYPQLGSAINALAVNLPFVVAAGGQQRFECVSAVQWFTI